MTLEPVVVEAFNGLDLRTDPIEVGAGSAQDVLNVDFDGPGRVRCRDGATKFNTSTGTGTNVALLAGNYGGTSMLVAVRDNAGTLNLDKIVSTGVRTAVTTLPAGFTEVHDWANFGSPTASRAYISMRGHTLQKFSGAAVSDSDGKPRYVTVFGTRVAQANYAAAADSPSGADGSVHTVFFSAADDPDVYAANDFIEVRPGDGEEIIGLESWADQLFIFKRTAVFVVYGVGTDSTGAPIFSFRQVDLPMGVMLPPAAGSGSGAYEPVATVGADGVYFASPAGVFKTAGGPPVEVSGKVQGVFTGTAVDELASARTVALVRWAQRRLYVTYNTRSGATLTLVWDSLLDQWTVWDGISYGLVAWDGRTGTGDTDTFFLSVSLSGSGNVYYLDSTSDDDVGSPVTWHYQSGNYPLADGRRATVRETVLAGSGTVTFKMSVNAGTVDTGGSVTLGVAPAIAEGRQRSGRQGWLFSHYLSGSGAATVNRLVHHVREARVVA